MIRKLCNVQDLPGEGRLKAFIDDRAPTQTALCVAVVGGQVYTFDNACPHQGAHLAAGRLEGEMIVCPVHSWKWNVTDGQAAHPADPALVSYEVRCYGDEAFVRIPAKPCLQKPL